MGNEVLLANSELAVEIHVIEYTPIGLRRSLTESDASFSNDSIDFSASKATAAKSPHDVTIARFVELIPSSEHVFSS
jgi:hypothetical protein